MMVNRVILEGDVQLQQINGQQDINQRRTIALAATELSRLVMEQQPKSI